MSDDSLLTKGLIYDIQKNVWNNDQKETILYLLTHTAGHVFLSYLGHGSILY